MKHNAYKQTWTKSFTKELAQLAQGYKDIQGTDSIYFIRHTDVPKNKTVTYGRIVVDYRPQKADPHRTRLMVEDDCIQYPHDVATPTADLTTCKVLFNSTISAPNAKFATIDIKNFYLNTPLDQYEYMRLPLDVIPEEIILTYDLQTLAHNGWVYIEIRKGMYGLPQAGILANKLLTARLHKYGYETSQKIPGL